jgi:hypothetical protein
LWDPSTSDISSAETAKYWDLYYAFFKDDMVRSIIYICLYIRLLKDSPPSTVAAGIGHANRLPDRHTFESNGGTSNMSRVIDNTIDAMARRIGNGEQGFQTSGHKSECSLSVC